MNLLKKGVDINECHHGGLMRVELKALWQKCRTRTASGTGYQGISLGGLSWPKHLILYRSSRIEGPNALDDSSGSC